MIHTIIEPIRTKLETLSFADRVAGLVIPVTQPTMKDGRKIGQITYPVACDVTGARCWEDGKYFDLLPGDAFQSVLYFEQLSDTTLTGFKDSKDRIMVFEADVRLVGWLNLKKLGYPDCSITSRLVLSIIKAIQETKGERARTAGKFTVTDAAFTNAKVEADFRGQKIRDRAIFSKYSFYKELLYPFDYFALDFHVWFEVGKECFTEFALQAEITC